MTTTNSRVRWSLAVLAAMSLIAASCGGDDDADTTTVAPDTTEVATTETTEAPAATDAPVVTEAPVETDAPMAAFDGDLVGTFSVDAAVCAEGDQVSGSYFRMVQIGGTLDAGPFIPNADSVCFDPTFTGLAPGSDGGLVTGTLQVAPDPAFDDAGNGLAAAIFEPVAFFAVAFAGAMDPDGETPTITAADGVLTGDLSAFTAYYGAGMFNQGAPKPDGSGDGPGGTIDPDTGAYVLEWSSLISGGSFDGFTGIWHLEGIFTPA